MKRGWFYLLAILLCYTTTAQRPLGLQSDQQLYQRAKALFDDAKYAPARRLFEDFKAEHCEINSSSICADADFHIARCALELYHKDAEFLMDAFIRNHPDSPQKERAHYEMGVFYGKKKMANKCLEWLNKVEVKSLMASEIIVYHFYRAQSFMDKDNRAAARTEYYAIKDLESPYRWTALYMYSHLTYETGDLTVALEGFLQLENQPTFEDKVPLYIAQIYYLQKKYDALIEYSEKVLVASQSLDEQKKAEISKMVGDAYYSKELYEEALLYLKDYLDHWGMEKMAKEDVYRYGYAKYRTEHFDEAISFFKTAKNDENELGQMAAYNEGICNLKLGYKREAWKAFGAAREMSFNQELQEDAMFNYAKIAFEISSDPFDDAITSFEEYLAKYPDSPRHDESYQFLLNVYMKTKNYEKALTALEKIKKKDNVVKAAYQNLSYNRGVELFQSREFTKCEKFFIQVNTYPIDERTSAKAIFWLAEAAYARADYPLAFNQYETFLNSTGAFNTEMYGLAYYGQAYCYFKRAANAKEEEEMMRLYRASLPYFKKFLEGSWEMELRKKYDAFLRIADIHFINKNYEEAILNYDRVADDSQGNKDYAMYQKAMGYGYLQQLEKKSWVLKSLLSELPGSKFEVDAIYELAKSYLVADRLQEAQEYYQVLFAKHSTSAYVKRALVDQCLLNAKLNDLGKMKNNWNQLVEQFPNDPILLDAIAIVRPLLIEDAAFQSQIKNLKVLNISNNEIEEEVYARAAELGFSENCEAAVPKLKQYIQQFQPALHGTEANYLLAECLIKSNQIEAALDAYNFVIAQPQSEYTEDALLSASSIQYNKKNWDIAAQHYLELEQKAVSKNNVLEAQVGLMRCYYFKEEFKLALEYANKVIDNAAIPDDIKNTAFLWRGKMYRHDAQNDLARKDFERVILLKGKMGAEAKYLHCESFYADSNFAACESEIYELVDQFAGFEDWKNKSFLLLVDCYIAMKDYFQAKSTIEAIEMNVSDEKIKDSAKQRWLVIEAKEAEEVEKNKRVVLPDEIQIQENNNVSPNNEGGNNE